MWGLDGSRGGFVGRRRELQDLRAEFDRKQPSLVVAWGRRRIGKSRLLREAAHGRPAILFQAARVSSTLNLEQFKAEVAKALGPSAVLQDVATWEGTLHFLAEIARDHHPGLVVVLDEFPYITDNDPALPSILQRFWDSGAAKAGNLKLVLCGSAIAQMEELLAERNALYGRKTKSLHVAPLTLREASEFFPDYSAEDIVKTYAVLGGVPWYLELCDPQRPFRDNVIDLLLREGGSLADEPNFLLQNELREPQVYSSILAAMSEGCVTSKEIADRLHVDPRSLGPYYGKLQKLELIRVERSLDADQKARNLRFDVNDPLIAFWHRFVRPNLSAIATGAGEEVYDVVVERGFPEYMGTAFEGLCRDFAQWHSKETMGVTAKEIGRIWGHADIDVAGRLLDGTFFYGECKWRPAAIDMGTVNTLKERSERTAYGRDAKGRQFLLFSRSGFKPDVAVLPSIDSSIHLIDPERLVFGTRETPEPHPTRVSGR